MKNTLTALTLFMFCASSAAAQDQSGERPTLRIPPSVETEDNNIKPEDEGLQTKKLIEDETLTGVLSTGPDYSQLTPKAEHTARLDALFDRLKSESNSDDAKLIAEEIWAIWLDSGSATVDLILLRGTAFEKRGEVAKARIMYDHVINLMPEYAEGWARSARLAYGVEDYGRALSDAAQALIYEPREFYALWTMGNVFEKLGRRQEAYETYTAALALYPEHPAIKDRVGALKSQVDGEVL